MNEVTVSSQPRCWESFFHHQHDPVLRSQILATLMVGTPLIVGRLSNQSLLDVMLLATAVRDRHDVEIVDDYQSLLDRTGEGSKLSERIAKICAKNVHIADMVMWYLRQGAPRYFAKEMETIAEVKRWRKAA